MYVPDAFRVDDPAVLHDVIRENAFGLLVTVEEGEPFANHVPFLLDETAGPRGTLLFHLARANPQAAALGRGCPALAVFQGPHGYVSPAWYEDRAASVPTWNFVAVHARGTATAIGDAQAVDALLRRLGARYEAGMPEPWTPDELAPRRLAGLHAAIVAFSMPIARIDGKFKLSQNRSPGDRAGVVAALRTGGDAALADAMVRAAPLDTGT